VAGLHIVPRFLRGLHGQTVELLGSRIIQGLYGPGTALLPERATERGHRWHNPVWPKGTGRGVQLREAGGQCWGAR
jgi:hypothetical protein